MPTTRATLYRTSAIRKRILLKVKVRVSLILGALQGEIWIEKGKRCFQKVTFALSTISSHFSITEFSSYYGVLVSNETKL